ncbi:MAG: hypothetical protein E6K18_08120 [Methanobacteriota archaeon]|nr:MAG: hypothetical protein E6K18_08120 [Euryarchaeota archaeon]
MEGEGDRILRAGSPMITDLDAAYAELWVLARRIGWYAMHVACVRYVKGEHLLVVPNESEIALFREAARTLEEGIKARREMASKKAA